jgi:hypothetical protein
LREDAGGSSDWPETLPHCIKCTISENSKGARWRSKDLMGKGLFFSIGTSHPPPFPQPLTNLDKVTAHPGQPRTHHWKLACLAHLVVEFFFWRVHNWAFSARSLFRKRHLAFHAVGDLSRTFQDWRGAMAPDLSPARGDHNQTLHGI